VVDTRFNIVAQVATDADEWGNLMLKHVRGGEPWKCPVEHARDATAAEKLHAGVELANARSRGECC
jgi:hypothetical protein